jgi:perosamine synthetase
MVVTNNERLAQKIRQLKGHGMDPHRRYWHPIIGYNYRMTNIAAAIGLAQLEKVEWQLRCRQEVTLWYREYLRHAPGIAWQCQQAWAKHVWWMFTIVVDNHHPGYRDDLMRHLRERGIETRPVVYPLHTLPPYRNATQPDCFPVAEHIARSGINLPTWAGLTREDVHHVCDNLLACYVPTQPI